MDVVCFTLIRAAAVNNILFSHQMLNKSTLTECVVLPVVSAVVCHPGANAGAHVKAQDLQPQPPRLSQDMPIPKMAENGSPTR